MTQTCKTCERATGKPARRPYAEDLTGARFGKLVVDSLACIKPRHWFCRCDCGKSALIEGGNLKRGYAKSCGKCTPRLPTYIELKALREGTYDATAL